MPNLLQESTITSCIIQARKKGPIVRIARQEPWESEVLLVQADQKYHLVILPCKAEARGLGPTPISKYWLDSSQSFDVLEDAQEAFDHVRSHN